MANKIKANENYLEKIPCRSQSISYSVDENGIVTLEIQNTGIFNRIVQKLFKRPKVSYIHLDENGSFVWQIIDGEKSILDLGKEVEERFGEASHPVYERLAKYFQILDSYGFITFK